MTPIYTGTKVIGHVEQGVFIKHVTGSKHFLRKPPGIAINIDAIEAAKRAHANVIQIVDAEGKRHYWVSMTDFYRHGARFNRGFGNQIVLPFERWHSTMGAALQPVAEQTALL